MNYKSQSYEKEYWKKICKELKIDTPNINTSLWQKVFEKTYMENKEVFSLIELLKKNGYKIGFLSNTEVPSMNFFFHRAYNIFDVIIFSCKEGFTKPDKRIYQIAIQRLGVHPHEAIMIDDKRENVVGAKKSGLIGVHFINYDLLCKNLTSLSVNII